MITFNVITMEFTRLLWNILYAQNVRMQLRENHWFECLANQTHVDFMEEHLNFETLDNFSEARLMPAAHALASKLGEAKISYPLINVNKYDCTIYNYEGVSVRGIVNREYEVFNADACESQIVNLIRFDIKWSK